MAQITLSDTILAGPDVMAVALLRVLERLAPESHRGELSLAVPLASLHLPGVGDLTVPVLLTLGEPSHAHGDTSFPVRLQARAKEHLFPAFSGTLRVHRAGEHRSDMILEGNYRPPAGWLGEAADKTLLRSAATLSLQTFLRHVGDAVVREMETPPLAAYRED